MIAVITISPDESIKVGDTIFKCIGMKGRNETMIRVETQEPLSMIRKNGTERKIENKLQKLTTAAVIREIVVDKVG